MVDPAPSAGPDFCLEYESVGAVPDAAAKILLMTPAGVLVMTKIVYNEIRFKKKCSEPKPSSNN